MLAVIDTRRQTAKTRIGQIHSLHTRLTTACAEAAKLCTGGTCRPTIWKVARKACQGMDLPWADVAWAKPMSPENYNRMDTLLAREIKKLVQDQPKKKIPHNKRYIDEEGRIVKKCPACGLVKTGEHYFASSYNGWAGRCKDCAKLVRKEKYRREAGKEGAK